MGNGFSFADQSHGPFSKHSGGVGIGEVAGRYIDIPFLNRFAGRYAGPEVAGEAPLIVKTDKKKDSAARSGDVGEKRGRWRPQATETGEEYLPLSVVDRIFKIIVTVARTMALMSALIICPVLCLGVLLAVPAGAPRVERAVNALTWAIVLVLLIMPLGGWFGMAWQQGTITDYKGLTTEVDGGRDGGLSPTFYARFLLLPTASAIGFILVGFQFSSAVGAVLLKRDGLDPELEREASNVSATSLHGASRSAGALSKALEADRKKKKKKAQSMSRMSPGEMPRRLI